MIHVSVNIYLIYMYKLATNIYSKCNCIFCGLWPFTCNLLYLNLSKGTSISNIVIEAYFHSFSLALLIILDVSVYERVE